jgi:polyhydroxybutyrate depolymerase
MWRGIQRICPVAFCLLAVASFVWAADAPAFPGQAGTFADEKITIGVETREYRLIVPDTLDLSKPVPIVFAFHGMGEDNKDHFATVSTLPALAAEHKFILVFPAAAAQLIQGQAVKAWALAPERAIADLQFFDALLAKMQAQYRIDPDAIYLTGMSNGAYFAHLLARERANVIAAVAAHSGELGQFDLNFIQSARKFPVMIIHGDADPVFDVSLARSARVTYEAAGHPVTYLEIPGWGHQWDPRVEEKIWDFFSKSRLHPTAPAVKAAAPATTAGASIVPAATSTSAAPSLPVPPHP